MMNRGMAEATVERISVLKFFPPVSDIGARTEIARIILDMVATDRYGTAQEKLDYLVKAAQVHGTWEGPGELRAMFCCRYKPADGIEAYSQLPGFCGPDIEAGLQSPALSPAPAPERFLPAPDDSPVGTELLEEIHSLADLKRVVTGGPNGK